MKKFRLFSTSAGVCALLLAAGAALAQTPVNQLHFSFADAPGGTTMSSDTKLNAGAISTTLTMYDTNGVPFDLHGPAGSGVNGLSTGLRAMDFTADLYPSQGTGEPADLVSGNPSANGAVVAADAGDPALGQLGNGGVISSFVATVWLKAVGKQGGTVGPRIWILNSGSPGVDVGGAANSMGLKFGTSAGVLTFAIGTDGSTVGPTLAGNYPTNKWYFVAVTYDGTNCSEFYGSDTAPTVLLGTAVSTNRSINLGSSATLSMGNRYTASAFNARGFNGWINDFRFYNGSPSTNDALAFVENIRKSLAPSVPAISGVYPDGTMLLENTNKLAFTAISTSGFNLTNVSVVLNGVDVSSALKFVTNGTPGTATNLSVSYFGLPPQQPTNTAIITVTDGLGLTNSSTISFDTFSPNNFQWEAVDYDFSTNNGDGTWTGGLFIDNPQPTGDTSSAFFQFLATNSYYDYPTAFTPAVDPFGAGAMAQQGVDMVWGNTGYPSYDYYYRNDGYVVSFVSGDFPRPQFIASQQAYADPHIGAFVVGDFYTGDWLNYTRHYPAGNYYVWTRMGGSAGAGFHADLSSVTSGAGTGDQTTAPVGSFVNGNPVGGGSYQWIQLQQSYTNGTKAVVTLTGLETLRATASGQFNMGFFMLVPVPAANFTATPTNGQAPLLVSFANTSTSSYTNSIWNFGDGGSLTNTGPSASHTYNSDGSYSVTLTVNGSDGTFTTTQTNCIAVTTPVLTTNSISLTGDMVAIQGLGTPGMSYVLLTATNVIGPWLPVATNTAATDTGALLFNDAKHDGQQYYRTYHN